MSNESIKNIFSSLSGFLPLKALMPASRQRFIFPFWHAVSDAPPAHLSALYQMPREKEFERDLDFFLKQFKCASIGQVEEFAMKKVDSKLNLFFPSFDDGLSECYHTIAPILKRKGIQAAFFINPEFGDNKKLFHRHKASVLLSRINQTKFNSKQIKEAGNLLDIEPENIQVFLRRAVFEDENSLNKLAKYFEIDFDDYLRNYQPYMTLAQIKELQNDGFFIGAHSMDHREFFHASEPEMIQEISSSISFVNQKIHPEKKWFAFPFTDSKVPDTVFEKANQENIWDLSFGTAGMKDETMPNHIQRIPMESSQMQSAEKVLQTEYSWYAIKSVFGKNKVNRQ